MSVLQSLSTAVRVLGSKYSCHCFSVWAELSVF